MNDNFFSPLLDHRSDVIISITSKYMLITSLKRFADSNILPIISANVLILFKSLKIAKIRYTRTISAFSLL